MKIGIRALLLGILKADDQIKGETIGASTLTLVNGYKATLESAATMRNGIERLKHELNEVVLSEARAHARLDGAIAAADNLRAQIVALTAERDAATTKGEDALIYAQAVVGGRNQADDLRREALRERDRMHDQWTEATKKHAQLQQERDAFEHQLATVVASYNAAQLALTDLRAGKTPRVGGAVPWTELEDGCLYADSKGGGMLAVFGARLQWLWSVQSRDLESLLLRGVGVPREEEIGGDGPHAILIARDLGSNPEEWRDAMQQHLMQKGTK